jgi:hypothetical protein
MNTRFTRRQIVARALLIGTMAPVVAALQPRSASADAPNVDPNDPMAKALGYVTVSAKPGFACNNCMQYHGNAGSLVGPCTIFPGKQVAAAGWCASWGKRPV